MEGFTHDGEFVLVAEDGANDLKNYPVKCVNGRIWVNNHAHVLQGKAGISDNSFLAFAISQSDIESLLVGGSRAKLNAETLMSIEFKLPCLQEQYRIGEYLTQLGHLITLHQRQPFLHSTPEISLTVQLIHPFYTSSWEQRKVGDLLIERNQQAPMSDEYPLMAFIANEGVAPKGERYDRSALVTDTVNKLYKKTEKGDFIYSSNNLETGSIGLNKYGKACISPVYSIFEPTGIADSDFLGRRLVRKDFINAMVKWRQGVIYGQWRIHESDFLKIEITVPSVEEQRKIGAYLDQLDNLITLHQRQPFLQSPPDISLIVQLTPPFYTFSWEQRKLASLCEKFTDGDWIESKDQSDFGVRLVQTGNVGVAEYLDKTNNKKWISEDTFDRLHCEEVLPGDILISRLPEPAGRACIVPLLGTKMITAVDCTIVRTAPDMSNKFLVQYLSSQAYFDDVNTCLAGGTRQRISRGNLANFNVPIPVKKSEQDAIGMFFGYLDNLITLHQRKFEKLTNVKKSMLEKMFPQNGSSYPEIRFKGFTDPWEQRKLSEIADKVTEKNAGLQYVETFTNSAEFGIISQRDFFDHDIAKLGSLDGYYIVKNEDFVYNPRISTSAPVGPINRNKLGRTGVMSPLYTVFRPHDVDTTYLEHFFKCAYWHSFMNFNGDSGARSDRFSIKDDVFFQMPIPLPYIDEQRKIGELLTRLDHLITLHQRQPFLHSTPEISLTVQLIHPFYTSSWEQRKLTEFVEFFSGLTYTPNDVQENGTLVLRSSNVSNGEVVDADNIYVNPQVVNSENVKVGDIVVVVRNGSRSLIGKHAQIKAFMPNTVIGAFMTGIRSECPEFTNALLNTSRFEEEIAMNMGATINQITGYMFSKMEFKVPCLDEQKKIGEYFEKLDNLITLHQRKGKAAVTGCSNDANNSKGVYCKARDFGYKCCKKVESP